MKIERPDHVIGKDTVPAMKSGIYWGYVGLIEGLTKRIQAEYGQPMRVIATGGLATLYNEATEAIEVVDQDLTVRGLRLIYDSSNYVVLADLDHPELGPGLGVYKPERGEQPLPD